MIYILWSLITLSLVGAAALFAGGKLLRIAAMISTGRHDVENHTEYKGSRWAMVGSIVFGHKKTLEDRVSGILHICFIYGFFILGAGHSEVVLEGATMFLKAFGLEPMLYERLPGLSHDSWIIHFYKISQDLMAVFVLGAALYAIYRRVTGKVERLKPRSGDAEVILWFIAILYISFFVLTGTQRLIEDNLRWHFDWYQPFSSLFALKWSLMTEYTIRSWNIFAWWIHVITFLSFACYIPMSKHMHLVFAGPNTWFFRIAPYGWRQPETLIAEAKKPPQERALPMGVPPRINFETAEKYGIDRVQELPWKTLLDTFACTECGRCNAVCPAHLTQKSLKPKKILHDIKVNLLKHNGPELLKFRDPLGRPLAELKAQEASYEPVLPLISTAAIDHSDANQVRYDGNYEQIDGQVHMDDAWACTTCGACFEACPVLIDSVPGSLLGLRQNAVMMESSFPDELKQTFKGLERQGNPWGVGQDKRLDWAAKLDVPVMADLVAENPEREVEYLFWVGCAGSTDDDAKKVQQALVRILKAAKVDFAILGCEEKCTGDPARRLGNEAVFNQLAQENIATLAQYKFKKIFTTCPHCFNTLKNEYGEFGVDYTLQHHSELIAELMKDKRIPIDTKKQINEHVTFHDPCYLGRYNKQYDAPREVLVQIGKKTTEINRADGSKAHKEASFCCGAGGGRVFMEEHHGKRINIERTEQALATGATTIAVGCPFCMRMISDGVKDKNAEEKVQVKDIAQLVAEQLVD